MGVGDTTDGPDRETPNEAGWASFEARVRDRRFARCLEHARAAIEGGQFDGARDSLNEAKKLSPDAPEIAELESIIALRPSPPPIASAPPIVSSAPMIVAPSAAPMFVFEPDRPRVGAGRVIAGMAVALVLCGLVAFGILQIQHTEPARQLLSMLRPSSTPDGMCRRPESRASPAGNCPISAASLPQLHHVEPAAPVADEKPDEKPDEKTRATAGSTVDGRSEKRSAAEISLRTCQHCAYDCGRTRTVVAAIVSGVSAAQPARRTSVSRGGER